MLKNAKMVCRSWNFAYVYNSSTVRSFQGNKIGDSNQIQESRQMITVNPYLKPLFPSFTDSILFRVSWMAVINLIVDTD